MKIVARCAVVVLMATVTATGSSAQTPLADPDAWITAADYPNDMPPEGGLANVEFDISAEGRVENCRGLHASPPQLESIVCGLLEERARYEPRMTPMATL